MFEFQYTLDDEDYLEFNKYHLLNSPAGKRNIRILRMLLPAMLAIMLLVIAMQSNADWMELLGVMTFFFIVSVIWIVTAQKTMLRSMRKSIHKLKKDGKLPYSKQTAIRFEDDAFHETTEDTETKTAYRKLENIAVSDHAIYAYTSAMQAYIIPLRVFESDAQRTAFMQFLNAKKDDAAAASMT